MIFNGSKCDQLTWINTTYISCAVPAGTGRSLAVNVTCAGQTSAVYQFAYMPPKVQSTSVAAPGSSIIVIGQNFGADPSVVTVMMGNTSCSDVKLTQPHLQLSCTVNMTAKSNSPIVVTVNGQSSDANLIYNLPGSVTQTGSDNSLANPPSSSSNIPIIAGAAGGGALLLLLVIIIIVLIFRRRRNKQINFPAVVDMSTFLPQFEKNTVIDATELKDMKPVSDIWMLF